MNRILSCLIGLSFFWCTSAVLGQQAVIEIEATDSLVYSVYHGGEPVCDGCDLTLYLDSLQAGTHLLDILTTTAPALHFRVEILLDSMTNARLRLSPDSTSHYILERMDAPQVIDYTLPAGQAASTIRIEVTELGTGAQCIPPLSPGAHTRNLSKLADYLFEREKVKLLESLLGNTCLSTQQIRELVEFVEDDERRLGLLVKAYGKCFDIEDFYELKDLLYLNRNRERFSMLFGD